MIIVCEYLGVAVAACAGTLMAGHKNLDLMGVVIVAIITSVGGGTLRDVLIDKPVFWLHSPGSIVVAAATACLLYFAMRCYTTLGSFNFQKKSAEQLNKYMLIADAITLAAFNAFGLLAAIPENLSSLAVVIMGGVTGVAGGLIRDVVCNEVPVVFRGTLYLTCAVAGGTVFVVLHDCKMPAATCAWVAFFVTAVTRLLSIQNNWHLPVFALNTNRDAV